MRLKTITIFILITLILMLSTSVYSSPKKNKITGPIILDHKRDNGNVYVTIEEKPTLKIIKQEGFEKNFNYDMYEDFGMWAVVICHKDFEANKNHKGLNKYKVKTKVKSKKIDKYPEIDQELDLKKYECEFLYIQPDIGDIIKFGENSTEIILDGDNVTFAVTPEYNNCDYLSCHSEIILTNNGNLPITINSSDIDIQVYNSKDHYINTEYKYETLINDTLENVTVMKDSTIGFNITLHPQESHIFQLYSIMNEPNQKYKYNVSFYYNGSYYLLDPYFNTTNSTFVLGTYNQTYLNESGFVQLNLTYNVGEYISKVFDSGYPNSIYTNITWNKNYYQPFTPDIHTTLYCDFDSTTDCDIGNMTGKSTSGISYDSGLFSTQGLNYSSSLSYLSYTSSGNINYSNGTLAFWIKARSDIWEDSSDYYIFDTFTNADNYDRIFINKGTTNKLFVRYYGNLLSRSYTTDVTDNWGTEWHHIAITWDVNGTKKFKLYLDGNQILPVPPDLFGMIANPTTFKIGSSYAGTGKFPGIFEELIIKNNTMTKSQIRELYRNGITRLNLSVRSCDDPSCSGESWEQEFTNSPQNLSISDNRYFQYKATFQTDNQNISSLLYNVSVGHEIEGIAIENVTIAPLNPTTTDDLMGYCTGIDADGSNISFDSRFYRNGTLYVENIDTFINDREEDWYGSFGGIPLFSSSYKAFDNSYLGAGATCSIQNCGLSFNFSTTNNIEYINYTISLFMHNTDYPVNNNEYKLYCFYGNDDEDNYEILRKSDADNLEYSQNFTGTLPNICLDNDGSVKFLLTYQRNGGYETGVLIEFELDYYYNLTDINNQSINLLNISSEDTLKNEDWIFSCRSYNGIDFSLWKNSSISTIQNTPPTFNQSNFYYSIPHNNNISLQINSTDIDIMDDNPHYTVNDTSFTINLTTGILNKTNDINTIGEYNITVNVNDTVNTSTMWIYVNITNTKPNITSVILMPIGAQTNDDLLVTNITVDNENDTITNYHIKWYINEIHAQALENISLLNYTNTLLNDNISVQMSVYDGNLWSEYTNSSIITIGDNVIPNLTNDQLSATSGSNDAPFSIYVNVTETNTVDYVRAQITDPNSIKTNFSMTLINGTSNDGRYSKTYTPSTDGIYNFTFYSRDGSGNIAVLESSLTYTESTVTQQQVGGGGGGATSTKKECDLTFEPNRIRIIGDEILTLQIFNNDTVAFSPNVVISDSLSHLKYTIPTTNILSNSYGEINLFSEDATISSTGTMTLTSSECADIIFNVNTNPSLISSDFLSEEIFTVGGFSITNTILIILGGIFGLSLSYTRKNIKLGTRLGIIIGSSLLVTLLFNLFF